MIPQRGASAIRPQKEVPLRRYFDFAIFLDQFGEAENGLSVDDLHGWIDERLSVFRHGSDRVDGFSAQFVLLDRGDVSGDTAAKDDTPS